MEIPILSSVAPSCGFQLATAALWITILVKKKVIDTATHLGRMLGIVVVRCKLVPPLIETHLLSTSSRSSPEQQDIHNCPTASASFQMSAVCSG